MTMAERINGINYRNGRDIKDVAKDIRKEIKARFPEIKTSVTIKRFSMGKSIDVHIKDVPFHIMNPARIEAEMVRDSNWYTHEVYTSEARELIKALEAIVKSYNREYVDTQADYWDVEFYSHVQFDTPQRNQEDKFIRNLVAREFRNIKWSTL